jgi:flagellin-like hook-associated protein FlgL
MASRRRLILLVALGLGLVGSIVCTAAIIALWSASARLRHTTEAVFAKVDGSLVTIQERAERTQERVKASAITTESIASSLKEWTKREAGQRLALQMNLAEKSDRLSFAMQQADDWLELSASSAQSVQQALSMISALGAQIDTGIIDAVIEEIASIRSQLAEATEFVENLHERTAAMGEDNPPEERIEQAVQLALRVIATLGSIDSRIERFENRLLQTQKNLQVLQIRSIKWIQVVTIAITTLIIWMAVGQVALSCLAWNHLRSKRGSTVDDHPPQ